MDIDPTAMPETTAAKLLKLKKLFPTTLTSAELRELDAAFLRQASFSAQTTMTDLLALYKKLVAQIVSPTGAEAPGQSGPSVAKARSTISDFFKDIGYEPEAGTQGCILDLSSFERIMLKLETDVAVNFGAGRFVKQNADPEVVEAYPGLELERTAIPRGGVDAERNWGERWIAAADAAGDERAAAVFRKTGRMVALKSSGIWQALGDGAGGFDDTLGNPYDPLAFNTYMRQFEASREDMESLGFLDVGEKAEPARFDLGSLFKEAA